MEAVHGSEPEYVPQYSNSRPCAIAQDRLLLLHWDVRLSFSRQRAANCALGENDAHALCDAGGQNTADPYKQRVLAHGSSGLSQCDGNSGPSHGTFSLIV